MHKVLGNLVGVCVLVYLDDVLVFSTNLEQHLRDLDCVLQRLSDNGLYVKLKKCEFGKTEVEYLGHVIG